MLICVFFLMATSFTFIFFQERVVQILRYKILFESREEVSKSIFKSRWELSTNYASGEIANKLIHETEKMTEALLSLVALSSLLLVIIYLIIALYLSINMTLFVTAILVFFLVITLTCSSRKLGGEIVTTNSLFSSQVVDAVKGFKL